MTQGDVQYRIDLQNVSVLSNLHGNSFFHMTGLWKMQITAVPAGLPVILPVIEKRMERKKQGCCIPTKTSSPVGQDACSYITHQYCSAEGSLTTG